jgi:hypothetical protein
MPEKKFPIVLRFASLFPAALARIEMHGRRSGGLLDNVELAFSDRNRVYVGERFAKDLRDEIERMSRINLLEEVAAAKARNRKKDAQRRKQEGLVPPWHGNSDGPIREAVVTASKEYFLADNCADHDDLLTTYGIAEDG